LDLAVRDLIGGLLAHPDTSYFITSLCWCSAFGNNRALIRFASFPRRSCGNQQQRSVDVVNGARLSVSFGMLRSIRFIDCERLPGL
jgi:hypothetical protein